MIHKLGTPQSFQADRISPSLSTPQIGLHRLATSSPRILRTESIVLVNPVARTTRSYCRSLPPLRTTVSSVKLFQAISTDARGILYAGLTDRSTLVQP